MAHSGRLAPGTVLRTIAVNKLFNQACSDPAVTPRRAPGAHPQRRIPARAPPQRSGSPVSTDTHTPPWSSCSSAGSCRRPRTRSRLGAERRGHSASQRRARWPDGVGRWREEGLTLAAVPVSLAGPVSGPAGADEASFCQVGAVVLAEVLTAGAAAAPV